MEREIKFRAWDKDGEQMITEGGYIQVHGNGHYAVFNESESEWLDKNCVIMQFTGLKDKNGKEIYEGDIIKLVDDSGNEIMVVCEYGIARRANHRNDLIDIPSFYFKKSDGTKSFPMVNNYLGKHDLELFEVIGNIFTHPQLLKHAH